MLSIQSIHKDLMDSINESIDVATEQLNQLDPSGEKYLLNVVVDAAIDGPDPSATQFSATLLHGVSLLSTRENIANVAASLTKTAGIAPPTVSDPKGVFAFDIFSTTFNVEEIFPKQGFSAN
jgi:hypothetical protein